MAIKTLEEREREALLQAQQQATAYEQAARSQAAQQTAAIGSRYQKLTNQAVKDYTASADASAEQYQTVFDANAVDEIVARRNAAEAIANSNMANSGLNSTQQTAISLQRQRADSLTAQQRQAAVDSIMAQLDAQKTQYAVAADQEKAAVTGSLETDIASKSADLFTQASESAAAAYNADVDKIQEYMDNYGYSYEEAASLVDGSPLEEESADQEAVVDVAALPDDVAEKYQHAQKTVALYSKNQNPNSLAKKLYDGAVKYLESVRKQYGQFVGGLDALPEATTWNGTWNPTVSSSAYQTSAGVANEEAVNRFARQFPTREVYDRGAGVRTGRGMATYEQYLQNVVLPNIISRGNRGELTESDVEWLFSLYGITSDMIA